MGEIADDMINGNSCSWYGIYFREAHGYPVLCQSCYQNWHREQKGNTSAKLLKDFALQIAFIKEL